MADYNIAPGLSVEVIPRREGCTMYLDVVVHTPWGNLTGRLAANAETLRQMMLSLRKQYGGALYDFALERPDFATLPNEAIAGTNKAVCTGAPSGRSMNGSMMITQRMTQTDPQYNAVYPFYRR